MSAMPALSTSSSLSPSDATSVSSRPWCSHQHVVQSADELPGELFLVGLLGDDGLPRLAEIIDEVRERQHERFAEQSGLRAEMAEEQILGDTGGLGDLAGRGAAVILAREQFSCRVEQ